MEFLEIAKKRISIRNYEDKKVEEDKANKIIMAAHVAPTAANLQPVTLVVVESKEGLAKIAKTANIFGAPMAFIVCSDHKKAWTRPMDGKQTTDIDASIVTDHMMMEAASIGLGSLWVGKFSPQVLREEFQLPENLEPISILGVGYAKDWDRKDRDFEKVRKPISELVIKY